MENFCTDRLEALMRHFPVRAHIFQSGPLCGLTTFSGVGQWGQLHLIREGTVEVVHPGGANLSIQEPTLLLYPRPFQRSFITDSEKGAAFACANLEFEGGEANPIGLALADHVCIPLRDIDDADSVLSLLFHEAFGLNCGRRELVGRLFEIVLIQVLRHLMESGKLDSGMLAGMSHPKIRAALIAMHEQPSADWTLDSLAELSAMSRSNFATAFRSTVGCTPGSYLQAWRVQLTKKELMRGKHLKTIAIDVGYGSEAALSRAFKAQSGLTPREWRQIQTAVDL